MFQDLIDKAHAAGMKAMGECRVHGPCGFAWITFKGNTKFGRWMKKMGYSRPNYPTGQCVRVYFGGQSIDQKEAYAHAYANVLREAGIMDAYPASRLD